MDFRNLSTALPAFFLGQNTMTANNMKNGLIQ